MKILKQSFEFEWDRGNTGKNKKHRVSEREAEQVFFDNHKTIYKDILHSKLEKRMIILGKTKDKRLLYVVFTTRNSKIRIISARDINKKEVKFYEKTA